MLGIIAAALEAMLVSAGFARSDQPPLHLFSASEPVRIYADPGHHVFVRLARTGRQRRGRRDFSQVSITGHLVDLG